MRRYIVTVDNAETGKRWFVKVEYPLRTDYVKHVIAMCPSAREARLVARALNALTKSQKESQV